MPKTDEKFETRYGSFLLRVRQDAPGIVKGQIVHVQSGVESTFANLIDVLRFIEAHLEPISESEWK